MSIVTGSTLCTSKQSPDLISAAPLWFRRFLVFLFRWLILVYQFRSWFLAGHLDLGLYGGSDKWNGCCCFIFGILVQITHHRGWHGIRGRVSLRRCTPGFLPICSAHVVLWSVKLLLRFLATGVLAFGSRQLERSWVGICGIPEGALGS